MKLILLSNVNKRFNFREHGSSIETTEVNIPFGSSQDSWVNNFGRRY